MSKLISLALVALTALLIQSSAAETTHVVLGDLGWIVPPGGPIAYRTWAATQTFTVGDILLFNFTTGDQDVARVTKEAFDACNSTSAIFVQKTGPFNYTLDAAGEYYFIGTMDRRCALGQKLAINVTAMGQSPAPEAPRSPITYTVGDSLGWEVPPGGEIAYTTWARNKVFMVGDVLVFNFINKTQDVAAVTKGAYETCNTTTATTVLANSPAKVTLTAAGEYFFTSTYDRHCDLGQKLAINVTGTATGSAPSPSSSTAGGPATAPPASSSAPPRLIFGFSFVTLLYALFLAAFH